MTTKPTSPNRLYLFNQIMYFTKKANHTVPRRDPKHIFHSNEPLIATLVLITYLYLKHDWT